MTRNVTCGWGQAQPGAVDGLDSPTPHIDARTRKGSYARWLPRTMGWARGPRVMSSLKSLPPLRISVSVRPEYIFHGPAVLLPFFYKYLSTTFLKCAARLTCNRPSVLAGTRLALCSAIATLITGIGVHALHNHSGNGKGTSTRADLLGLRVAATENSARILSLVAVSSARNRSGSASLHEDVGDSLGGGLSIAAVVARPAAVETPRTLEADLDITSKDSFWAQAGQKWGVDPLLIYSVALVESRELQQNGNVAPTPWVARINQHLVMGEKGRVEEALVLAQNSAASVQDVGIMQVYYPMHLDLESNAVALLDPKHNIMIGTQILRESMTETKDPVLGVGFYHSHDHLRACYYGQAVLTVYHRLQYLLRPDATARVASVR